MDRLRLRLRLRNELNNYNPISPKYPLTLASASPRRKQLLTQVGIPFHAVASHVVEDDVREDPETGSMVLAESKALEGYRLSGAFWTLGADTMVVIGKDILGKPADAADAGKMLRVLSGRTHQVLTGLSLLNPDGKPVHAEAVTTDVRFKSLTGREIESYIRIGEPFGKAGAYAIQGIGAFMVKGIAGSYTNVVGLPVCALVEALVSTGALTEFP
ncbi:MAG: septum formation protein Maf, partial [Deltaproteobacteria bacterium]|nr:septum formation protein Maf [Deltaproteobacteria bacterium]